MRRKEIKGRAKKSQIEPGTIIQGQSASAGLAFGSSVIFNRERSCIISESSLPQKHHNHTIDDFMKAVSSTDIELINLQETFSKKLPENAALIFSAQTMMLKDRKFTPVIIEKIINGATPVRAICDVANHYTGIFMAHPDPYIREKKADVQDLANRILKNLFHGQEIEIDKNNPAGQNIRADNERVEKIIIAKDIFPSEVLKLSLDNIQGIILIGGVITSHVSILARSLELPVIITSETGLLRIFKGTQILMDADEGNIYIQPSKSVMEEFDAKNKARKTMETLSGSMLPETKTVDGVKVKLLATVNLLSQLDSAKKLKAEGIGLYRTEFPFLIRSELPTEAEQYVIYKKVLDSMPEGEVTIRTLDIGGDKSLMNASSEEHEANPELGLRSIRFSLRNKDVFIQQIRAILRAGAGKKNLRIMFPMISSLDEFREAKKIVINCAETLSEEKLPHHAKPEIGMMVEIPSVVETIYAYTREADFFSIGTNDFVQYMLAVDRQNKRVSNYYCSYHPAVLRALARIIRAVTNAGKPVSICGEMARDPECVPFLLGIGVRSLSVDPQFLPAVQAQITSLRMSELNTFSALVLQEDTISGVRTVLDSFLKGCVSKIVPFQKKCKKIDSYKYFKKVSMA